jgi:hypothetical protein
VAERLPRRRGGDRSAGVREHPDHRPVGADQFLRGGRRFHRAATRWSSPPGSRPRLAVGCCRGDILSPCARTAGLLYAGAPVGDAFDFPPHRPHEGRRAPAPRHTTPVSSETARRHRYDDRGRRAAAGWTLLGHGAGHDRRVRFDSAFTVLDAGATERVVESLLTCLPSTALRARAPRAAGRPGPSAPRIRRAFLQELVRVDRPTPAADLFAPSARGLPRAPGTPVSGSRSTRHGGDAVARLIAG